MARVIPIDIIKGISGKYGKNAGFFCVFSHIKRIFAAEFKT